MKTKTGCYIFSVNKHTDDRGWLIELFRNDLMSHPPKMAYVSETNAGVVRGPHEHKEQTDNFVFVGPGNFDLHLWNVKLKVYEIFRVGIDNPVLVVVPPNVVHAYKNVSAIPGWVFNAPDKLYSGPGKLYDVDEIRHEDNCNESIYNFNLYRKDGWEYHENLEPI